jgi:hypothetical protein
MRLIFQFNELITLSHGIGLYVCAWRMVAGIGLEYIPMSPGAYSAGLKKL